jgi:hypothetical protein
MIVSDHDGGSRCGRHESIGMVTQGNLNPVEKKMVLVSSQRTEAK